MSTLTDYKYPVIGSKGVFEVAHPFSAILQEKLVYECVSIVKIKTLEERYNVKVNVYTGNGLTETDYKYALQQDIPMVELRDERLSTIYVPANYILTYPNSDGVRYKYINLNVSFPLSPETLDTGTLKSLIEAEALGIYGVEVQIDVPEPEALYLTTYHDHDTITLERKLAKTKTVSDKQLISELGATVAAQRDRILALEEFIRIHHGP